MSCEHSTPLCANASCAPLVCASEYPLGWAPAHVPGHILNCASAPVKYDRTTRFESKSKWRLLCHRRLRLVGRLLTVSVVPPG
eukprot:2550272-Prymnesium_polylepis.1